MDKQRVRPAPSPPPRDDSGAGPLRAPGAGSTWTDIGLQVLKRKCKRVDEVFVRECHNGWALLHRATIAQDAMGGMAPFFVTLDRNWERIEVAVRSERRDFAVRFVARRSVRERLSIRTHGC